MITKRTTGTDRKLFDFQLLYCNAIHASLFVLIAGFQCLRICGDAMALDRRWVLSGVIGRLPLVTGILKYLDVMLI